jgi:hypothetical protein
MSRIRSIHPGFFTDEDLVSVSMGARVLFLGLGVESDDKGIFEWKPLTIKMRLFPADNVDVAEMLAELSGVGAIRQYDHDGRKYGAIRNFRRFQKPKTPNDIHPATPEILTFVGLVSETKTDGEGPFPPNGETFPPKGEKSPQMEDGGGRGEEEGKGEKGGFAFSGEVIRLNQRDFDRWQRSFSDIDLRAALQSRDDWLSRQPEPDRKRWFNSTSNWLAKRQQAEKTGAKIEMVSPC